MSNIHHFNKKYPKIGKLSYVDKTATLIGDVKIGNDCSIWPNTVIRGDVNYITIGNETNIQDGSVLHVTHKSESNHNGYPLKIASKVTIGHKSILHGCEIHELSLIGMGCVILDGAIIKKNVLVGANSLVSGNKILKSGYLYIGQPAKDIRKLTTKEINYFEYSACHYVNLKNKYLSNS